jgi:hypothetical protein
MAAGCRVPFNRHKIGCESTCSVFSEKHLAVQPKAIDARRSLFFFLSAVERVTVLSV